MTTSRRTSLPSAMKFSPAAPRSRASKRLRIISARRVRHTPLLIPLLLGSHVLVGKPVSHQFAKELLAGFAGAEVDKLAETKGEDWFDREKTKRHAKERAEQMYDEHYIDNQGANQYDPNQYDRPQRFEQRGW